MRLKHFLERERRVWPVFDRSSQTDNFISKPITVLLKERDIYDPLKPFDFVWEVLEGMAIKIIGISRLGELGKVVKSLVSGDDSHGLPTTLLDKIYFLGRCIVNYKSGTQISKFRPRNKEKDHTKNKKNESKWNRWKNVKNHKSEDVNRKKEMKDYDSGKKNTDIGRMEHLSRWNRESTRKPVQWDGKSGKNEVNFTKKIVEKKNG